jgi:Family of unknown function (DUF6134)
MIRLSPLPQRLESKEGLFTSIGGTKSGRPLACLRSMFAAALFLLGIVTAVPTSAGTQAAPQTLEFDITREGDVVGHHRIDFRREGDKLVVHSELQIEIEALFLTIYRYQQTREEVWRNGKLVALTATADDDGTPHDIKGTAAPNGEIKMSSGKDRWTLPPESVPASYWNQSMVTQKGPLVDSLTGRLLRHGAVKLGRRRSAPAAATSSPPAIGSKASARATSGTMPAAAG